MYRHSLSALTLLVSLFLMSGEVRAQNFDPDYVDGKIYFQTRETIAAHKWGPLHTEFGTETVLQPFRSLGMETTYSVRFRNFREVEKLIAELESWPEVVYAEKVPLYQSYHTPDDLQSNQWALYKVEAEAAWDLVRGSHDVLIGVIDDAIYVDHEDLAPQVWTNPGEIPNDGIDNDNNGYIDDVNGYDVADDDSDPRPPAGAGWGMAHGTHTSAIAAASTNNSKGMASIAYNCQLVPIKAKHDSTLGQNQIDATTEGMDYAIASGAKVINMSFGGSGFSLTTQNLLNSGYYQGVVWIAASGNDGQWQARYPAAYQNVISVGSTKPDDVISGFSNYHPTVDVMAPGSGIWAAFVDSPTSYTIMSGTSMASPMAVSLCGLMLSINPELSPDEVEDCLKTSCDDISAQNSQLTGLIGAGRINARKAVLCVPRLAAPQAEFVFDRDTICVGETVTFTDLSQEFPQSWTWDFGDGSSDTSLLNADHSYLTAGTFSVSLIVSNNQGSDTLSFLNAVTVLAAPNIMADLESGGSSLLASGCADYFWSPATGLSCTNCSNPQLSNDPDSVATYYVASCTNAAGCTSTDTVFISSPVSSPLAFQLQNFISPAYPNPNQGQVNLRVSFPKAGMLSIELVNLQGQKVQAIHKGFCNGPFKQSISVSPNLANGTYLLNWYFRGERWVQKIVVNR